MRGLGGWEVGRRGWIAGTGVVVAALVVVSGGGCGCGGRKRGGGC